MPGACEIRSFPLTALLYILPAAGAVLFAAELVFRRYVVARVCDVFEEVPPFGVIPAEESPDAETFSVQTSDGMTLRGSLHLPKSGRPIGLVVFCPELNGNHWMASHYCHGLLQNQFAVLGFDFRGQGSSDPDPNYTPIHWVTEYEMRDIAAVLEFVESDERLNTLPLGLFGVSRGGVAALAAACRYPRVRAVLADSAFGTMDMARHFVHQFGRYIIPEFCFRILPKWHIEQTLQRAVRLSERRRHCRYVHLENEAVGLDHTHVQLISGQRDSYVSPDVAAALAELFGGSDRLWLVRRARHNMARSVRTDEYDRRVVRHFLSMTDRKQPRRTEADTAVSTANSPVSVHDPA